MQFATIMINCIYLWQDIWELAWGTWANSSALSIKGKIYEDNMTEAKETSLMYFVMILVDKRYQPVIGGLLKYN